jgi:hypothetical protein
MALSLSTSLSTSLPLSGGVAFSELSEAERESAHIRSRSTSEAEDGRKGEVNDVANGLDRRESDRYLGASRLGRRNRKRRGFRPLNSSLGDWRGDEGARRAKSVDEAGREDLGRWGLGLLDIVNSGVTVSERYQRTAAFTLIAFRGIQTDRPAPSRTFQSPRRDRPFRIRLFSLA